MGRQWILADLDKREKATWGKFGDFWGGSLVFLDNFLCYRPVYLADLEDVRLPAFLEEIKSPPRATACAAA
ncbi:hypothetical protein HETIRDRAFT_449263 [Heterobasidion irregulare TC 32-1]|uniref:Uncharacterized protein n=1 Tax=Heterobasidion irregulare (strain TC 32-1) TaxID=747525 RepID=W4KCU1_HETIT|nr:uncharacterized protein HETIRDRAFT_449263 [Heterobasidion irregulare TC 32-1]ETW83559.1 hypothetical protein HETIRDRAFT_449263 [Heterobasidion irregulare TC 32-1]